MTLKEIQDQETADESARRQAALEASSSHGGDSGSQLDATGAGEASPGAATPSKNKDAKVLSSNNFCAKFCNILILVTRSLAY